MNRKPINVLVATFLCLAAATPATSAIAARASTSARSSVAGRVDMAEAQLGGVSVEVLRLALGAVQCATASGDIKAPPTLTLIDYSRPSVEPRMWVFDLKSGRLLFKELVAHGRNTGENMATRFSDAMNSHQTSLGLFVTSNAYVGTNGYSLRLDGLEAGFNGRARERAIVMHGAPYVDAKLAATQGRIGRSWGCPALREAVARDVIDTIRGGGVIFSYYPDAAWLKSSRYLNGCGGSAPPQYSPPRNLARRKAAPQLRRPFCVLRSEFRVRVLSSSSTFGVPGSRFCVRASSPNAERST